jgi:anti-sigma-K factor RskA
MPRLAPGRAYQAWLTGGATPASAGIMASASGGALAPLSAPYTGDTSGVAISVEPAHGSAAPTTSPIMQIPLG